MHGSELLVFFASEVPGYFDDRTSALDIMDRVQWVVSNLVTGVHRGSRYLPSLETVRRCLGMLPFDVQEEVLSQYDSSLEEMWSRIPVERESWERMDQHARARANRAAGALMQIDMRVRQLLATESIEFQIGETVLRQLGSPLAAHADLTKDGRVPVVREVKGNVRDRRIQVTVEFLTQPEIANLRKEER